MSAYQVSMDHIGFLINLGRRLGVRSVDFEGRQRSFDLDEVGDRSEVASSLVEANRSGVACRYRTTLPPAPTGLVFRVVDVPIDDVADWAQVLQWIACYRYQCSDSPVWPRSFAHAFTARLRDDLLDRLLTSIPTSWDYDGPALLTAGC